jgi:adenosylcobyric acid synthase
VTSAPASKHDPVFGPAAVGLAPVVMVQGCTSDAGKSLLVSALCRALFHRGFRVAPFKAQNMSNNAAVCFDGSEIGRAQFLQARAAGIEPDSRMNPVLLKPTADTASSVILMGRPAAQLTVVPWRERREHVWPVVQGALRSLRTEVDLVIAEGAGSPAEVNLREHDIVNMSVALEASASVYLVADIDRGGAFAHLLGTVECLEPEERQLVRGFVLNKFRGDEQLLAPAPEWLATKTGIDIVAVVPWMHHRLPDEDRLLLHQTHEGRSTPSDLDAHAKRVAIVAFPWASNFDEFEPLVDYESVVVDVVRDRVDLAAYDAVILPGSRNTIASLHWLRTSGLAAEVTRAARRGVYVLGICGGMQLLGHSIGDPFGIESGGTHPGLGLLDIETVLEAEKTTRNVTAVLVDTGSPVSGYEIHHGVTTAGPDAQPVLDGGRGWQCQNVTGVYLHGLFDDSQFRVRFMNAIGLAPTGAADQRSTIDSELDRLALAVEQSGWVERVLDDLRASGVEQAPRYA